MSLIIILLKGQYNRKCLLKTKPIACVEFHHVEPEKKSFQIAHAAYHGISKSIILKELEKCIPLCANCHRKLHYEQKKNM